MRFWTFSPDERYREPFGPVCICAESNTMLFVEMEPATSPPVTVVTVLALVKH
jgi:hypothetical protein